MRRLVSTKPLWTANELQIANKKVVFWLHAQTRKRDVQ